MVIFPSFGLCFYIKNVWNLQARGMRSTHVFHSEVPWFPVWVGLHLHAERKTNQPLSIKLRVITNTKHSCVIICVHTHRNSFTRSFSTLLWVDRDVSNQYASIHKPKYLYLMSNICKHLEVCMCYSCWWWIRFHPSMRVHTHTHTRAWKALYSCSSSLLSISFLPHPPAFLLPPCLIQPHTLSSTDPLFLVFLLVDCIHTAVEAALLCGSQAW